MTFRAHMISWLQSMAFASLLPVAIHAGAAEHAHEHGAVAPAPEAAPKPTETPASGKAREAGFRGAEMMPSTTIENDLARRCEHARDGLILLDRATLAKCAPNAQPVTAPTSTPPLPHHQH
jgi:hypothetical protein